MTKVDKLNTFLKSLPKDWNSLESSERKAKAAKASGMSVPYLTVHIMNHPQLKPTFAIKSRGKLRRKAQRGVRGVNPERIISALDSLTLDQLVEIGKRTRKLIGKRLGEAQALLKD